MVDQSLSDLERELLVLCSAAPNMGETTATLLEETLADSCSREAVEGLLRGLVARGFMTTSRGVFAGKQRTRDGRLEDRVYEDDWWVLTDKGRAAIGLPRRSHPVHDDPGESEGGG